MKKILFFAVLIIPFFCSAQLDFGLQFGFNYPIDYSSDGISRQLGSEFGAQLSRELNNNFGIETGLLIETFGRLNSTATDPAYTAFQLYLPIIATYKLKDDKLILKLGVFVGAKNIIRFSKYNEYSSIIDNEEDYNLAVRHIGTDFSVGLCYKFNEKLGANISFRTPFDINKQEYGVVSCGLNYKIVSH